MDVNTYVYYIVLGILLPIVALIYDGIERKLTARLQGRVGPPITQSWLDFIKLLTKRTKLPEDTNLIMLFTGLVFIFAGSFVPLIMVFMRQGDLILLMYLMVGGTLGIILTGMAFRSPYSRVGVSREIQMAFVYEISFIMAIIMTLTITGYRTLDGYTVNVVPILRWPLLIIPLILFFLIIPAKVGIVPMDIGEAESELAEGPFVELGGRYLAIAKISKSMRMLAVMQLVTLLYFLPSNIPIQLYWVLSLVIDGILMFLTITIVRNSVSRIKIDQAVKFYGTVPLAIGVIGLVIVYVLRGWGM